MVGIVFQLRHTVFRMLPNPTISHWDMKPSDLLALIEEYSKAFTEIEVPDRELREVETLSAGPTAMSHHKQLKKSLKEIIEGFGIEDVKIVPCITKGSKNTARSVSNWDVESQKRFPCRRRPLRMEDEENKGDKGKQTNHQNRAQTPYPLSVFCRLHDAIRVCDSYLEEKDWLRRLTLRTHLQEVLNFLNTKPGEKIPENNTNYIAPEREQSNLASMFSISSKHQVPTIHEIDQAFEQKHRLLIHLYFHSIRNRVIKSALNHLDSLSNNNTSTMATEEKLQRQQDISDIWLTLIFRMLCWLLLHDFHQKDIQISKSDTYQSRMPVFIL